MDGRSPISCHILDTSVGKPARGVRVRLEGPLPDPSSAPASASPGATATSNGGAETATVTSPSGTTSASALDAAPSAAAAASVKTFESQTDDDGRIKSWLPYSSARASGDVPTYTLEDVLSAHEGAALPGSRTVWTLRFDVEGYFGRGNTFFPEVVVTFAVEKGQHYHVPLLLAPYSYSTYRGS